MWSYKDLSPKLEKKIKCYPPDEVDNLDKQFEDLLDIYWTAYTVAPSIQIDYKEAYLKNCAKYLREKLTLNETGDEKIQVTFKELKGLVLTDYDKPSLEHLNRHLRMSDSIFILCNTPMTYLQFCAERQSAIAELIKLTPTDLSYSATVSVKYDKVVKYTGIFLSCGTAKPHDGVYLPLLLVNGSTKLSLTINNILAEILNCNIRKYDMLHDFMWWILSVIVQTVDDYSENEMELEFKLPAINKKYESGTVSYFIPGKHATVVWRRYCKNKKKILQKNMKDFRDEICKHVEDLLGILISKLIFSRIRHNTIFTNGTKFKTTSNYVLCNVLIYLCQNFCLSNHSHD